MKLTWGTAHFHGHFTFHTSERERGKGLAVAGAGWARRRLDSWAVEVAWRRAQNSLGGRAPLHQGNGAWSPSSSWSMGPWAAVLVGRGAAGSGLLRAGSDGLPMATPLRHYHWKMGWCLELAVHKCGWWLQSISGQPFYVPSQLDKPHVGRQCGSLPLPHVTSGFSGLLRHKTQVGRGETA